MSLSSPNTSSNSVRIILTFNATVVDSDKYLLHVYCRGNQTDTHGNKLPTVLLEAGEGTVEDGLWQFADAAIANGSISRYCFVDRPGFGWVSKLTLWAAETLD